MKQLKKVLALPTESITDLLSQITSKNALKALNDLVTAVSSTPGVSLTAKDIDNYVDKHLLLSSKLNSNDLDDYIYTVADTTLKMLLKEIGRRFIKDDATIEEAKSKFSPDKVVVTEEVFNFSKTLKFWKNKEQTCSELETYYKKKQEPKKSCLRKTKSEVTTPQVIKLVDYSDSEHDKATQANKLWGFNDDGSRKTPGTDTRTKPTKITFKTWEPQDVKHIMRKIPELHEETEFERAPDATVSNTNSELSTPISPQAFQGFSKTNKALGIYAPSKPQDPDSGNNPQEDLNALLLMSETDLVRWS